ncbi:MAG TPA: hypothetical protein PKK23_08480 [Nitrospirales bacterium]|nr:hypothetical protein [Nitrospiraceae bacterium]HNP29065.1 hypothetical protein [Nitrospirales bacterium]
MNVRLLFGLLGLVVSSCGPTQQWVKPGATEADLRSTITLCDRENRHFNRSGIAHFGPEDETIQPRNYRRGGGDMMREQCLEGHGWRREYVE